MALKICIDPGHGGQDPGAVGRAGAHESSINLAASLQLAEALRTMGHAVLLTRADDDFVSLSDRARIANEWGADRFVSLHCNASGDPRPSGFEAWTTKGQTAADPIAENLVVAWVRRFPSEIIRRDTIDGDSDKEANYAVLRLSAMPAVLVEMGFISHPASEAEMITEAWQEAAAQTIAKGITA